MTGLSDLRRAEDDGLWTWLLPYLVSRRDRIQLAVDILEMIADGLPHDERQEHE